MKIVIIKYRNTHKNDNKNQDHIMTIMLIVLYKFKIDLLYKSAIYVEIQYNYDIYIYI